MTGSSVVDGQRKHRRRRPARRHHRGLVGAGVVAAIGLVAGACSSSDEPLASDAVGVTVAAASEAETESAASADPGAALTLEVQASDPDGETDGDPAGATATTAPGGSTDDSTSASDDADDSNDGDDDSTSTASSAGSSTTSATTSASTSTTATTSTTSTATSPSTTSASTTTTRATTTTRRTTTTQRTTTTTRQTTTTVGSDVHPDIVRVIDVPGRNPRGRSWADSYSVGTQCYCASTFDHGIGDLPVDTPAGRKTVREVCDQIGDGPGIDGRPIYNDIQCGNGPANNAGDEDDCPGRVDIGRDGCGHIGPTWDLTVFR